MTLSAFGHGYGDILSRIRCRGCAGMFEEASTETSKDIVLIKWIEAMTLYSSWRDPSFSTT